MVLLAEGGAIAWIASVNWQNVAGTIALTATALAGTFLTIRQMFRADRRKYEAENKDSLMVQIEELNVKVARSIDVDKSRARQIAALQRQNSEAAIRTERLSALLMESNEKNTELIEKNTEMMREMARHQQILRDAGHRTVDQMGTATGVVQAAAAEIQDVAGAIVDAVRQTPPEGSKREEA